MLSDVEIAQGAKIEKIIAAAHRLGLIENDLEIFWQVQGENLS